VGAVILSRLKADDSSRLTQVRQNGLNGPPVLDRLGDQLCYKACKSSCSCSSMTGSEANFLVLLDEEAAKSKRIAEIMGKESGTLAP
jgi:hypothetical protein